MMSVNMFLFSQHRNWAVAGTAGQSWAAGLNKSISDGLVAGGGGDAGTRHTGSGAAEQWTGPVIYPDREIAAAPACCCCWEHCTKAPTPAHHNNHTNNTNSSHPHTPQLDQPGLDTNLLVNTRQPRRTRQLSEYLKFHHFFAAYQREK